MRSAPLVPANRFARILHTMPCIARPKRQAPAARERLSAFAEEYARQEADLERAAEKLRDARDRAIREAYREGLPMTDIAGLLEMSHQRVSQIVRS